MFASPEELASASLLARAGERFADGRYVLRRVLGQGGMGAVYEATQTATGRPVALKIIPAIDEQTVQRFEREASTVSRLAHPNTITVHDFGRTRDGELFLAMELLQGSSLKAVIEREAPLPAKRLAHIISQITHALTEAHDLGIVHRDIKPDNIFLLQVQGDPDFVKVLDFGIAKAIHGELATDLTVEGRIVGTPKYMAPEQIMSQPADRRADLYSLGCVLYELACGQPPFTGTAAMLMIAHTRNPRPALVRRQDRPMPEVSLEALDQIIQRAMAIDPEQRYASMRTFREDLLALLDPERAPPRRVTSSYAALRAAPADQDDDAPTTALVRPQWQAPASLAPGQTPGQTPAQTPGQTPGQRSGQRSGQMSGPLRAPAHPWPLDPPDQAARTKIMRSPQEPPARRDDPGVASSTIAPPPEASASSDDASSPPERLGLYWGGLGVASLALLAALVRVCAGAPPAAPPVSVPEQAPAPAAPNPDVVALTDARVVEQARRAVEVGYADKSLTLCLPLLERQAQVEACEAIAARAYALKGDAASACPLLRRSLARSPEASVLKDWFRRLDCP